MKKTIWITGTLLAIGIAVILMYFSFFQGKDSSTMPEGTFVKEVGDGTSLQAAFAPERPFVKDVKEAANEIGRLKGTLMPEGIFVKGIELKGAKIEWRQNA